MSNVAALLRERDGYLARGLTARVRQVDAELARLGFAVDDRPTTGPAENTSRRRK